VACIYKVLATTNANTRRLAVRSIAWLGVAVICELLRFASVASQCGNLVVLERKVVAEFSRASRKGAADLCGDDNLVARMSEVGWVGMWFVGGMGFLNPSFDCVGAVIFASFIRYKRISGEKSANVSVSCALNA